MFSNQKAYFSQLLKSLNQHHSQAYRSPNLHHIVSSTQSCVQNAIDGIIIGLIDFKPAPDKVQNIIKLPFQSKFNSDITEIDLKIHENQNMLKQAKKQLILHKRKQQEALKLQQSIKAKYNQEKIKAWSEQQRRYDQKRQQLFDKQQRLIEEEEIQIKKLRESQKQQQVQERRQSLERRLKAMQQSRQKRKQFFAQGCQQYTNVKQPRFKQIQKQYQKVVAEQNFERQIIKKNQKISKEFDFNMIKDHQKKFMEKIYERIKDKAYSQQNQDQKQISETKFKNLLKRTDEQIQFEKLKLQRRKGFQQRLEELSISIDDSKRIKIQIAKDKAKNPLKYNFLRQKNLNEYQIYMQFKDFQLDIDRNELGNGYLEEAKKIGEESRMKKSHSVSVVSLKNNYDHSKYKNYLPELRVHQSAYSIESNPQKSIRDVFRGELNPQRAFEKISISLRKYEDSIKDKRFELRTLNTISSALKKQREIDEIYMKSLKAKITCLEMN